MKKNDKSVKSGVSDKAPEAAAAPEFATVEVSDETLDATPPRLLKFLRGVGTHAEIQVALLAVGYDTEEHALGWRLLHACSGFAPTSGPATPINREVSDSIATLDARDERAHSLIDGTLRHRAPSIHTALLRDLRPGRGAESVLFFQTLLGRLDQLEAGTLAKVSGREAKSALELLAKRGMSAPWRAEHLALVTRAQALTAATTSLSATKLSREGMIENLRAARAFYEEWAVIARSEVRRKDYLIVLGLASRKVTKKAAPPEK